MPEYLAPGVFVEEVDTGSKPIEGVGINTAAFIGFAKSGEFNKPIFVSDWSTFRNTFGEDEAKYIKALCDEFTMAAKKVVEEKRASRKSWFEFTQRAVTKGEKDPKAAQKKWEEFAKKYKLTGDTSPYIEEPVLDENGNVKWYVRSYLALAVRGFYDNGGGRAYVVRIPRPEDLAVHEYAPSGNGRAALPAGTEAEIAAGAVTFKALEAGPGGNDIKVSVSHDDVPDNGFRLTITGHDGKQETYGFGDEKPLTMRTVRTAFQAKASAYVTAQATATADRPAVGNYQLQGGALAPAESSAPAPVKSTSLVSYAPDAIGDEDERTGVGGLAPIEDVNMILIPDLMAGLFKREPGLDGKPGEEELDLEAFEKRKQGIRDAQCGLVAYCERKADRMAILDPLPGLTAQEMRDTTRSTPYNSDHGQGTIYYPWIKIADPDPKNKGKQLLCPPSGHIAGLWARVGTERGVHKAPANEALLGAVALEREVSKGDQEILNPFGINAIRSFTGQGIRVWGARTLATEGNPSWKYVNVRRLFNYLKVSLDHGLQWVVFEPNDQDLWGRVRRNISAFLFTEWREGKLFGQSPAEAFFVKCDAETNPQEMIDLGRLYCEIGINPVKPAEFVIIRIGQWSSGGSMAEE